MSESGTSGANGQHELHQQRATLLRWQLRRGGCVTWREGVMAAVRGGLAMSGWGGWGHPCIAPSLAAKDDALKHGHFRFSFLVSRFPTE